MSLRLFFRGLKASAASGFVLCTNLVGWWVLRFAQDDKALMAEKQIPLRGMTARKATARAKARKTAAKSVLCFPPHRTMKLFAGDTVCSG
jgi:hypothetical protein